MYTGRDIVCSHFYPQTLMAPPAQCNHELPGLQKNMTTDIKINMGLPHPF